MSAMQTFDPEEILLRANALFRADQSKDLRDVIAEKIVELRHYDVLAMDRVVAILMWGRTGSVLLSSYLDGHADVIMLPELRSLRLYQFFKLYQSLPLRDKLLGFPTFYTQFFDGDFAISSAQYYAAVQAILEFYGKWPTEFLESRRAFFLFVNIAYSLALGRRPASANPLIVFAQHDWDNITAKQLVEDFPQAKFVHTIRDPISSCNGMFQFIISDMAAKFPRTHMLAPHGAIMRLVNKDRPHPGMESRSRAIRFEDLHCANAQTIRDLACWLGLPYQATLLQSTFNGSPYVVQRDGKAWSGPSLEQGKRQSKNLSLKDRAFLFASFYENFVEWNYPCPKIFKHPLVRCIVFVSLFPFPMKMEIVAARGLFQRWTLPSVRHGNISAIIKSLLSIGLCRLKLIRLLVPAFFRRCAYGTTLLQVDPKKRPLKQRDVGAMAARSDAKLP